MQFTLNRQLLGLGALTAFSLLPATMHAGTFTNGDFELPGGATDFFSSPTSATGWLHAGTGLDSYSLDSDYGLVADSGSHFITFGHNGTTGDTLSQTFDTIAGDHYSVGYKLMLQQVGALLTQSVSLEAFDASNSSSLGSVQTDFTYVTWTPGNTLTFTATSNSSTITFTDLTSTGNSGPLNWDLDTVTVTDTNQSAAPEPASFVLLGGALVAIGAARRLRLTR